jgi:hypothetical protein
VSRVAWIVVRGSRASAGRHRGSREGVAGEGEGINDCARERPVSGEALEVLRGDASEREGIDDRGRGPLVSGKASEVVRGGCG